MDHMTTLPGIPSKDDYRPGMAYFMGTGPVGKTCGNCANRGYYRKAETSDRTYKVSKCAVFKKMTGNHGADIRANYPACKYFEPASK